MFVQIEVTTRCNYSCSYCAGRSMEQTDLSWEAFTNIVDENPNARGFVIQGEGEPTLWPHFKDAVKLLRDKSFIVRTITNGTTIHGDMRTLIKDNFQEISISIDTLDPGLSTKIGRPNLAKVLSNIAVLKSVAPLLRIKIMTVDFGQDLTDLKSWTKENRFGHLIQPLQQKADYAVNYPKNTFPNVVTMHNNKPKSCSYLDSFLNNDTSFVFYNIKSDRLPCCFIKNNSATTWPSASEVRDTLRNGGYNMHCSNCRHLQTTK